VHDGVVSDGRPASQPGSTWQYATPTGAPCPRTVREDGSVEGSGACLGCGVCLLFGGLIDFGRPLAPSDYSPVGGAD
jgi:hypothetical protein